MSDVRGRIAAFEHGFVRRVSTRSERCRFGTAWFHDGFPRRWDSNFVWVEEPLEGVSAEELAADVEDVLGRAGLAHRACWVQDLAEGERLIAGLASLGYHVDRDVVMAHAREPDRWNDERAEEIDLDSAKAFYERANLEGTTVDDAEDARMLAAFRDVLVERVGDRFFGARVDGEVVAGCELYALGDVSMVEDVYTLEAHRGQGFARAVVLAAIRAAHDAGADLVFLGADDTDWPKHLYAKLGFDEVDRSLDFVRKPPARSAQRA